MDVPLNRSCPFQKAPQFAALSPHEFPEFHKADLGHLHACVGFDAPQQIGATPRRQAMAPGSIPEKAQLVAHAAIIPIRSTRRHGNADRLRLLESKLRLEFLPHVRIQSPLGIFPACPNPMTARRPKITTTPRSI